MESSPTRGSGSESPPLLGLQVWRPVPPAGIINDSTGAGCYSLVGSQGIIPSIPENEGRFTLSPSPVYDIPFQHGDVLGFYVNISNNDEDDDINLNILSAPISNMMVWYTNNQIASTIYLLIGNSPPGDLDSSSRVAPAISIAIGKQSPHDHYLQYNNYEVL